MPQKQLLIASLCSFSALAVKNTLERCTREDHCAHIAPVRHQPRCAGKAVLQTDQALRTAGKSRNFGGVHAGFFAAQLLADILTLQQHALVSELHGSRVLAKSAMAASC